MKPSTQGKLLLAVIMALALLCYVAITAQTSKARDAGIYEVTAGDVSYSNFGAPAHVRGSNEMKRLAMRPRH